MKHLKLFENFEYQLIEESLEIASLAKNLYLYLKNKGLKVGLNYGNEKTASFFQKSDGQKYFSRPNQKAETTLGQSVEDDVLIWAQIDKENEMFSKIGLRFRKLQNTQEAEFVGNLIKNLNDFINSPIKDPTGKTLDKTYSESLTIRCPFGWKLDEFQSKIEEYIKKNGYFYTNESLILLEPKRTPKKSEQEIKLDRGKVMGLKKGEVSENGFYTLYGSPYLYTGKEEDKKQEEVPILVANEKTKKVAYSEWASNGETLDRVINLAKSYAKKMNFTYVKQSIWGRDSVNYQDK